MGPYPHVVVTLLFWGVDKFGCIHWIQFQQRDMVRYGLMRELLPTSYFSVGLARNTPSVMTPRAANFLLLNQSKRSCSYISYQLYTYTTHTTKTCSLSKRLWISGRDYPSENTVALSKHNVHWAWWGTLQRKTSKIWCVPE